LIFENDFSYDKVIEFFDLSLHVGFGAFDRWCDERRTIGSHMDNVRSCWSRHRSLFCLLVTKRMSDSNPVDQQTDSEAPADPPVEKAQSTEAATPPEKVKVKNPRSKAQMDSFRKAQAARMDSIRRQKEGKPGRKHRRHVREESTDESDEEDEPRQVDFELSIDDLASRIAAKLQPASREPAKSNYYLGNHTKPRPYSLRFL
jgi:hypothetical protein